MLKAVLHDWDDERAVAILRRCRKAMSDDARLLVIESAPAQVVTEQDIPSLMIDILAMATVGGGLRTEEEFQGLFDASDLMLTTISDPIPPSGYRVIEAMGRT